MIAVNIDSPVRGINGVANKKLQLISICFSTTREQYILKYIIKHTGLCCISPIRFWILVCLCTHIIQGFSISAAEYA